MIKRYIFRKTETGWAMDVVEIVKNEQLDIAINDPRDLIDYPEDGEGNPLVGERATLLLDSLPEATAVALSELADALIITP